MRTNSHTLDALERSADFAHRASQATTDFQDYWLGSAARHSHRGSYRLVDIGIYTCCVSIRLVSQDESVSTTVYLCRR